VQPTLETKMAEKEKTLIRLGYESSVPVCMGAQCRPISYKYYYSPGNPVATKKNKQT